MGSRSPGAPQSARRGCLTGAGLIAVALGVFVYLAADFVSGYESVGESPRILVPEGGELDLRAGEYEVHYLSDDFVAAGLCHERADSSSNDAVVIPYWYCTSGALARAGGLTITGPGGDELALEEDTDGDREPDHLRVWAFDAPEAGIHRIEMPDPPTGIHGVAIRYVDDGRTSPISLALGWTVPVCGLAGLFIGIRALVRQARNPLPAAAGWRADPTGRADQRWWDGGRWTDAVVRDGHVDVDPVAGAPPP
jgi:hypothetical protein